MEVDDVEGEFFDFLHQQAVHLTEVDTLLFHFLGCGDMAVATMATKEKNFFIIDFFDVFC